MKIKWYFANGKVAEVEVTEAQAEVIIKAKQKFENNETKHKRRKLRESSLEQLAKKRGRKPAAEAAKVKSYDKVTKAAQGSPTKRVYICSPLRGNIDRNMARARIYCRFAFESGYVPICPHIYYTQFLDDEVKAERAAGRRYGLEAMWQARELWVFGANITEGMRTEIELAEDLKIPVKYYDEDMEERT